MKTPEEILINNCPVFSSLFHDKSNKASVMMKESILKSMDEYAGEWHKAFRDLSVSHVNQGKEIHELKAKVSELNGYLEDRHKYIEELEMTLGLRNRSNPDLTIDDEL